MNLSCIIVDDEPLAIRLLEKFVERTPFLSLKASFTDSVAALQTIRDDSADVLFLDIQMPDIDGMELSYMVPPHTRIIFTTAFKEYAFDSYEVNALDFLLKPIRYNKFLAAAEKAKKWFEMASQPISNQRTTVFLKVDGELQQVPLSDVVYVEGMKDYVIFHLSDRRLITHMTMKTAEELLPTNGFMRVNRSYIVALDKIRKVDRNDCIYIGNEIIHVTDAFLAPFKEYLEERKR